MSSVLLLSLSLTHTYTFSDQVNIRISCNVEVFRYGTTMVTPDATYPV